MKIRLDVLFLVFMFIFAKQGSCDESGEARLLFYQGNSYYSEEKFEEAISYYGKVLDSGFESGPLYYNLGNAYFKNGFLGKAILNYLRAKRFMPKDSDLRSNLDYAQSLIKGGRVIAKRNWFSRVFFGFADSFSLNRIVLFSAVLYFILSLLIISIIVIKNLRRLFGYISGMGTILIILCLSIFFAQFYKTVIQKQAVITAQVSDAKFEPFDDATTFFILNEGEGVTIIASKKDWIKVKRPDDKQGWIKRSTADQI